MPSIESRQWAGGTKLSVAPNYHAVVATEGAEKWGSPKKMFEIAST